MSIVLLSLLNVLFIVHSSCKNTGLGSCNWHVTAKEGDLRNESTHKTVLLYTKPFESLRERFKEI